MVTLRSLIGAAHVRAVAAVVATFVLLLVIPPTTALAHALLVWSSPRAGAALDRSPATVVLSFGERADPRLSAIHVLDASGTRRDVGPTTAVPGSTELQVAVGPLPEGAYTVTWRTVSADDGHLATGAFAFGVEVAPAAAPPPRADLASPPPSTIAITGRALLYIGMVAVFGIPVIAMVAFPDAPRAVVRLLPAAALVLAAGVLMVAEAQRSDAGVALGDYLGSSLSRGLVDRAVPTAVAVVAAISTRFARTPYRTRVGLLIVAVAGAMVMLMDVDTSHATAGSLPRLNGAFQWLHAMSVGVWMGGLAALLAGIRGAPCEVSARAVRNFSTVAGVALVVVGVTGLIRAGVEVGSLTALTTPLFGRLVLLKIGLISALAALGAVNRFRHVPRVPHVLRGLRRVGSAELGIAAVTLIVAGTLVNTVPPASAVTARVATFPAYMAQSDQRHLDGRRPSQYHEVSLNMQGNTGVGRVSHERRCWSGAGHAVLLPLPLRVS